MRIKNSGKVGIGTVSPDGTLHVHTATAGSVEAVGWADECVVESDVSGGISILVPDDAISRLVLGHEADNWAAEIAFDASNDLCSIGTQTASGALSFTTAGGTEAMRIDSSQRVLVGHTASNDGAGNGSKLQIHSTSGTAAVSANRWSANNSSAYIIGSKSRGATIGTNATVVTGDKILSILGAADDGTNLVSVVGEIRFGVEGTVDEDITPGNIVLSTTAAGAQTVTEAMRIDSSQNVGIQETTPQAELEVANNIYIGTDAVVAGSETLATLASYNNDSSGHNQVAASIVIANENADAWDGSVARMDTSMAFNVSENSVLTEAMRIDSSQRVIVGHTASVSLGGAGGDLQVHDNGSTNISLARWSADDSGPSILGAKSRNATIGSYTIVQDDDTLLTINAYGDNGTDMDDRAASIQFSVDGTPGADGTTDMPGRITFSTSADGSATPTEAMRIDSSQNVTIGASATETAKLHVYSGYNGAAVDADAAADDLVVENSDSGGISILTPNTNSGYLMFGDDDNDVGSIIYDHGTGMVFVVETNEAFRVDSSQRVLVGHTVSDSGGDYDGLIQVHSSGASANIGINRWSADASPPFLAFSKSRNATKGNHAIVQSGDNVGLINAYVDDGSDLVSVAAAISFWVEGTIDENITPGRIVFSTTAAGAQAVTEAMQIDSSQNVNVTTSASISNVDEGGTGRLNILTVREEHTLAAAGTSDTTMSIPSGCQIIGVQMCVNTAVSDDGGDDTWAAQFVTGDTTAISAAGTAAAKNTKVDTLIVPVITSDVTEVRFTAQGGSFDGGVIEVVVYYRTLTSMANEP